MLSTTIFKVIPYPQRAVFICRCGHSGRTLLARILATHPNAFSVPYETEVFLNPEKPNWRRLIVLFSRAALSGHHALVEKTPRHILSVDTIRDTISGPKFIVVTRDGRDVVSSLARRYGNFYKAYRRWVKDSKASLSAIEKPDSLRWRYKDLIEDPATSINEVCNFIGIQYSPELLNYHEKHLSWGKNWVRRSQHGKLREAQVNQPIMDRRGVWKSELPKDVAALFLTGEGRILMQKLRYI